MRFGCVFVLMVLMASSCRDKIICPAFQSTYILDDSTRTAFFSYAWQLDDQTRQEYISSLANQADTLDSVGVGGANAGWGEYYAYAGQYNPRREIVRKSKYGIVRYEPYWLKNYHMKTAPMENVLGPEKPTVEPVDEGEFYASDLAADSASVVLDDSTSVASDSVVFASAEPEAAAEEPKKKEQRYRFRYDPKDNFNVEQDYYNKYFGILLLDLRPEPEPAPIDSLASDQIPESLPDSLQNQKKGLGGLFKKKNKEEPQPEDTPPPTEEEEGDEGEGN